MVQMKQIFIAIGKWEWLWSSHTEKSTGTPDRQEDAICTMSGDWPHCSFLFFCIQFLEFNINKAVHYLILGLINSGSMVTSNLWS